MDSPRHPRCRERTEPDRFSNDGIIALESRRPKPVGKHHCSARGRSVISLVQQAPQHRTQPQNPEIRALEHTPAPFAWFAETNRGEPDGGELAERTQRL